MTVYLYAEYDVADFPFDLIVNENPGGSAVNVTLYSAASQRLVHYNVAAVLTSALATASWLATALTAESVAEGGSRTYQVTFSETTGFTITTAPATSIALTFSTVHTRQMLGFAGNRTAATSHVSDVRPYYLINAASPGRSFVTDDYERQMLSAQAESDDGLGYGVQVGAAALLSDFALVNENKAATFKRSATAAVPWTYQHLIEHCRVKYALAVRDTLASETSIHRLRPEGASWSQQVRQRFVGEDFDDSWRINFQTRLIGRL